MTKPIFAKRHYEAVADALAWARPQIEAGNYAAVVDTFASAFASDNPNFKPGRFRVAADVEE